MNTQTLPVSSFSETPDPQNDVIFWGRCQKRLTYARQRLTPSNFSWILGLFIFTAALPVFAQEITLWNQTATPANLAVADTNSVELGVKFRVTVPGHIKGLWFYKDLDNDGPHTGSLWTITGDLLATTDFNDEPASDGWQRADFPEPVPVAAGQTYVLSYFAPTGKYSVDPSFFLVSGVSNGPLQLLQDGINGGNGVFIYGPTSTFPSNTFNANNYWIDPIFIADGNNTLAIGDQYGGGIVVWVDEAGQSGIIAALADQSTGSRWYDGSRKVTGAEGDGLGAGQMNTALIISAQIGDDPAGNFAAKIAADYSVQEDGVSACTGSASETCHGDWHLPSKFVLNLMYENLHLSGMGGFTSLFYWSSTENGSNVGFAWAQGFGNGVQANLGKSISFRVRAVRAFNN